MNWEIFSTDGYVSIALWLCMPLLWLVYLMWRRGFLVKLTLILGVAAFVFAKDNSEMYVNRIRVDRSQEIARQREREEEQRQRARQAATESREGAVAQIRFAEDAAGDFLDTAGMDESELKYMQSFDEEETPAWKKEKKQRSEGAADDSLESKIGAADESEGVDAEVLIEEEPADPIFMSDRDMLMANRLDAANLMITRILLGIAIMLVVFDYLRRVNIYRQATFPLPLPSRLVDAITPMPAVRVRPKRPRRKMVSELKVLLKRGDSFVYMTDDPEAADRVPSRVCRLPRTRFLLNPMPVDILDVSVNEAFDDDFVFETLWFGRNSFVVDSAERAQQMLQRFVELLSQRRASRARVRQTVHIVWDVSVQISEQMRHRFEDLGHATGYSIFLCQENS